MELQKTIKQELSIKGAGLHTGCRVTVRLKPSPENSGISFIRVDGRQQSVIKASYESILINSKIPRCTSIGNGKVVIHTVEHLMSVLYGLGIDNAMIEIDGEELPGLDGSGLEFLRAIKKVGIIEQRAPRQYIEIKEPLVVHEGDSSIIIVPDQELKISYTLAYQHSYLNSQFFTATVNSITYEQDIAPSRTFCLEEEAQFLLSQGLGKGANYENTLVIGKNGVIQNQLRFKDEFARHKVLDLIGDIYLLGKPIRGYIFAIKSGHYLNIELLKKIWLHDQPSQKKSFIPEYALGDKKELDIHQIMKILPHRFPFLLVDRVIELEKAKRIVGIKNVTINDPFFAGHFPSRSIMPGVLIVEAIAQTAGILVLTDENHQGKVALFLGANNIKFRKLVGPGEQLIMTVEMTRDRSKTAILYGQAKVNGEVVAEVDLIFSFTNASFLD